MASLSSVLVLLSSLAASPAPARVAGAPMPGNPVKRAKILQLMHLTHEDDVTDSLLQRFRAVMPAEQFDAWSKTVDHDELVRLLIPVYDRHFTEQDLDGLIAFYKTALGQKVIVEMPAVAQESSAIAMKYAQDLFAQSAQQQKTAPPAKGPPTVPPDRSK